MSNNEFLQIGATGGKKYDANKLDLTREFLEVWKILRMGGRLYGENNWQFVEPERYRAALFRHIMDYFDGHAVDSKSGRHALAHAVCNCLFLMWMDFQNSQTKQPTEAAKP